MESSKENKAEQEYLKRLVESGVDERSSKKIQNSSISFYLQAGDEETLEHSSCIS